MRKISCLTVCCMVLIIILCGCGKADESQSSSQAMKRVGAEKFGYIDVPEDWEEYVPDEDDPDESMIQYSDPSGTDILTLVYLENTDAQTYSLQLWDRFYGNIKNLTSDIVDINGTKTYRLSGYSEDTGKVLFCWVQDGSDGYTHCVSIEGLEQETFMISNTFRSDR